MQVSRPRKPRPPPGEPVEFVVWRYAESTAKGRRRQVAYIASVGSDLGAVLLSLGVGRYRVEWRDRQRQVAHVRVYEVAPDGSCGRVPPARRAGPRKLPPPRYVAPGTHPAYVAHAPVAAPPPPERRPPPPERQPPPRHHQPQPHPPRPPRHPR